MCAYFASRKIVRSSAWGARISPPRKSNPTSKIQGRGWNFRWEEGRTCFLPSGHGHIMLAPNAPPRLKTSALPFGGESALF